MSGALYSGPILDAHHHLWDISLGRHPWLLGGDPGDEIAPLRRSAMPADYAALAAAANIVASVHVEANWDFADPVGETLWLDTLKRPAGLAGRYVAYVPLAEVRAPAILEAHAAHHRVTGIREILSWHPDPVKRRLPDNARLTDPAWQANLALLARFGFTFDLLITPHQLADAASLAAAFPGIGFALNHCGSPMDRNADGMAFWRQGLARIAQCPNVVVKVSDPVAYDPHWTYESLAAVIDTVIGIFGPSRTLFATDYPVAGLHIGFAEWIDVFRRAVNRFTPAEQRAMFHDNAKAFYRF